MKKLKSIMLLLLIIPCMLIFTACGDDSNGGGGSASAYNVTFKIGNAVYETIEVDKGSYVEKPEDPILSNYLFEGWYLGSKEWSFENNTVGKNITLTAKFDYGYSYQGTKVTGLTEYGQSLTEIYIAEGMTEIANNAFKDCTHIKSVVIPNSMVTIGTNVFAGCYLEKMTMPFVGKNKATEGFLGYLFGATNNLKNKTTVPESLKEIEITNCGTIKYGTFYECSSLTSITFSENCNVETFESQAFFKCTGLTSLEIPSSVKTIGSKAFSGCTNLRSITFGDNSKITKIDNSSFYDCDGLMSIEIPSSVKTIGETAFYDCDKLESVTMPSSVTAIEKSAFYNCKALTSIEIKSNVTSIGESAFRGCTNLTSVIFGNDIKLSDINSSMFYGCTNLVSVEIPSSVVVIRESAFSDCSSLTSVTFGLNSKLTGIDKSVFSNCTNLTNIEIPINVTTINEAAFSNCSNLISVEVSSNLISVGKDVFKDCNKLSNIYFNNDLDHWCDMNLSSWELKPMEFAEHFFLKNDDDEYEEITGELRIPDTVTKINAYAFSGFNNITKIVLSGTVTDIGEAAFSNCANLTRIDISSNLTNIGELAFENCKSLSNMYFNGTLEQWCNMDLSGWDLKPMSYVDHFFIKNDENIDAELAGDISIPETVTKIKPYIFNGFRNITKVTISNTVTTIDSFAFYDCSKLTNIIFESSSQLKIIGESAFASCVALIGIEMPEGVTTIGESAFAFCVGLTNIEIPEGVINISKETFSLCENLERVEIPSSVVSIGESAFFNCNKLSSIEIPSSVKIIDETSFKNCTKLVNLYFNGTLADWCNMDLNGWGLKPMDFSKYFHVRNEISNYEEVNGDLIIPDTVTKIRAYTFSGFENIRSVVLPQSLTKIEESAFLGCIRLVEVNNLSSLNIVSGSKDYGEVGCYALRVYGTGTSYLSQLNGFITFNDGTDIFLVSYTGPETEITIPSDVTKINHYAFASCVNLTKINFEEDADLKDIGKYAFASCVGLTSIEIPTSVKNIGQGALYNCNNLESIIIPNMPSGYLGFIFGAGGASDNKKYVPESLKEVEITKCTGINKYAFADCNNLVTVIFGKDSEIEKIEDYAFKGCSRLTTIVFSSLIEKIGYGAFSNCSVLTNISIPVSVTDIGEYAFSGCSNLTSIVIPEAVKTIGAYAFKDCSNLIGVDFQNKTGWKTGYNDNFTTIEVTILSDPSKAAGYLTKTFLSQNWKVD